MITNLDISDQPLWDVDEYWPGEQGWDPTPSQEGWWGNGGGYQSLTVFTPQPIVPAAALLTKISFRAVLLTDLFVDPSSFYAAVSVTRTAMDGNPAHNDWGLYDPLFTGETTFEVTSDHTYMYFDWDIAEDVTLNDQYNQGYYEQFWNNPTGLRFTIAGVAPWPAPDGLSSDPAWPYYWRIALTGIEVDQETAPCFFTGYRDTYESGCTSA